MQIRKTSVISRASPPGRKHPGYILLHPEGRGFEEVVWKKAAGLSRRETLAWVFQAQASLYAPAPRRYHRVPAMTNKATDLLKLLEKKVEPASAPETEPAPKLDHGVPPLKEHSHFGEITSFIWSVADLLRGDYTQSEYGRVILPFTVLRRSDAPQTFCCTQTEA